MKKRLIYIVLILVPFLNFCEKDVQNDDDLLFEVELSEYADGISVNEGDTIPVLKGQNFGYKLSAHDNAEYKWDFGENTIILGYNVKHIYRENGVFKVTIIKNGSDYFIFYVKVYGQILKDSEEEYIGIFLSKEINGERYAVTYKDNGCELLIHKIVNNNVELFKEPNGYFCFVQNAYIDNNRDLVILSNDRFCKVNLQTGIYFENYFWSIPDYEWNFYENSENNYYLTGTKIREYSNYSEIFFVNWSNTGEFIDSMTLAYNSIDDITNVDCVFLNDNEYLLLQNNRLSSSSVESVKLIRKNLLNANEIKLNISDSFYSKIRKVENGFLLTGFDINWTCGGCGVYLNITKISSELEVEWTLQSDFNVYESYLNNNYYLNNKTKLDNVLNVVELSDSYMFFYLNSLIKVSKSGELLLEKEFFDPNYTINDVSLNTDNKIEILGTVQNDIYENDTYRIVKIPSLISVNFDGDLID